MVRDFNAERPNIGDREYARPIHSDSLAISPGQVEEHRRMFPDVPIDSECRPVFTSFKQHDSYLRTCGFEKLPGKPRKRGKRIATQGK